MDSKGFKLTVTVDTNAVSDELDKVTNGLKKEFNELQEEYVDLKAEYDQRVKELAEISKYIEDLVKYGFKDEISHQLHTAMPFVKIADIVGAEIPDTKEYFARAGDTITETIMDNDLKEKMVWVKELGVYILPKEK